MFASFGVAVDACAVLVNWNAASIGPFGVDTGRIAGVEFRLRPFLDHLVTGFAVVARM